MARLRRKTLQAQKQAVSRTLARLKDLDKKLKKKQREMNRG
jgi:hypothetical protein